MTVAWLISASLCNVRAGVRPEMPPRTYRFPGNPSGALSAGHTPTSPHFSSLPALARHHSCSLRPADLPHNQISNDEAGPTARLSSPRRRSAGCT
ncbi:uncharacterized protein SCHCODRAFT_02640483 [Schizophyllum commune H4-8]|uniref:uncharacterized protein n=1 Tax=Schizophyllum commune (strain H4-8 / FGSC 9210) TaxID=578458 RepID=UPI002160DC04|nr:uncharacterized protein SCHCODRAFT_02640483 [Schizophyllum commune H4-8]KAI5887004.1 hypothetical protein SCHCODRAFT_02640483 [Schizophyllum commune H4-8]